MKPTIILDSIRNAGLVLSLLPGDLLKVEPKEKITDEIRQTIKEHKAELVRLLSGGQAPIRTSARHWTPGNPFVCSCGHATGWQLNSTPLCPVCFHKLHGIDPPEAQPETHPPRQVVCQAFEHSGVLMATASKHCLEWQCHYCKGCELLTVQ